MEFDRVPARGDGIRADGFLMQRLCIHLARGQRFFWLVFCGRQFDGNVGLLEGRDLIMIWIFGIGLVLRAVNQVKMETVGALADDDTLFG